MTITSFWQLEKQIINTYLTNNTKEGLSLINRNLSAFENYKPVLYYWMTKLIVKENRQEDAILVLRNALSEGYWYSAETLIEDKDLASLREYESYQEVIDISHKMQELQEANFLPQLVIRPKDACGPQDTGCPLFYFIHDSADQAINHLPQWHSLSHQGWIVGMPQAEKVKWVGAYEWSTLKVAEKEILAKLAHLKMQYSVDNHRLVIGGYGQGAAFALSMLLNEQINCSGFVLINPSGKLFDEISEIETSIKNYRKLNKRGIIFTSKDFSRVPMQKINSIVEMLNQGGIDTELKVIENSIEYYPESFSTEIPLITKFISSVE